jgi:hypothetical protein
MKIFRLFGAACALSLAFVHEGVAGKVQGFEAGDPAVTKTGDGIVKQTYQGVVPPEGVNQFLLTTINTAGQDGTDGYSSQSGSNSVINSSLQSFFGVSGLLGTEGSGFKMSIVVPAGLNTVTFQYDFLTTEFGGSAHQDLAFAVLLDGTNTLIGGVRTIARPSDINTADPARQLPSGPVATNPFIFDTGFKTFTITGLAPGTYTLGIGIEDATTTDHPSGILVDNIQIVPEPSTIGLLLAGAASCVAMRRRLKK